MTQVDNNDKTTTEETKPVSFSRNFQKLMKKHNKRHVRHLKKMKELEILEELKKEAKLNRLKKQIDKESYGFLKQIFTTVTPEERNEFGVVVKKSTTTIDKDSLIKECEYAVALFREERIRDGKRKRTSGSHSQRTSHRHLIDFLNDRQESLIKEVQVEQEKRLNQEG